MLLKYASKLISQRAATARLDALRQREATALPTLFPSLPKSRTDPLMQKIRDEYAPFYQRYTGGVSTNREAVSFESMALIVYLIRTMPVKSVMDTGSGFSSFVMRREAISKGGIHHVALEDNDFWLGKTREFLTAEGVPNDNVLSWNDYQKSPGKFDLIFHDLGNPTTRILSLPTIRDSITPGGLLLLDDMHKQHYAPHVPNILGDGWALESLLGLTLDSLGRFAYAARPK